MSRLRCSKAFRWTRRPNIWSSSLEQAHDLPKQVDDMVHAWQRGDTRGSSREIKSDLGRDPGALSVASGGAQPQVDRTNRGAARR